VVYSFYHRGATPRRWHLNNSIHRQTSRRHTMAAARV